MTSHAVDTEDRKGLARMGHVLLHEFRLVVPPTLFFFVGFNLILLTKRLFLADYLIAYTGFLIATTSALVVGKVVLVADKLPLLKSLDDQPLAYPSCSRPSSIRSLSLSPGCWRRSSTS